MAPSKLVIRGKIVLFGDMDAGKTALVKSFESEGSAFPKSHQMTITPEIITRTVSIPETDACVELLVLDLPGNDVYQSVVERHCHGASAFIIAFDVSNKDGLASIGKWLKLAGTIRESTPLVGCLVATKCDLPSRRRAVSTQKGLDVAQSLNLEYFECSAANNTEVESPFYYIANALHEIYEEHVKLLTQ
ncbi:P-loop containing nucleoside triphosphate hydrolase protein [Catenaria anguillulae PL171]|uniref:p-loop containing nucleoside triphosphate hydrolase protein n=1 Tax=Catenaria anguillulae PL171 TaxID=765915 RepID=A0A1Y2I524_9FUNG|nr:P-loop containing nucleoside triphosphate hydrolase protein [Catenaria anguillulae PL171]